MPNAVTSETAQTDEDDTQELAEQLIVYLTEIDAEFRQKILHIEEEHVRREYDETIYLEVDT